MKRIGKLLVGMGLMATLATSAFAGGVYGFSFSYSSGPRYYHPRPYYYSYGYYCAPPPVVYYPPRVVYRYYYGPPTYYYYGGYYYCH